MRRKRIAVLMAGVDREYQLALTKGMTRAALAAGVDLCVFNCQGQPDGFVRDDRGERAIFVLPELAAVDGAVVMLATIPTKVCRDQIRAMMDREPDVPVVTIDVRYGNSVQMGFDDAISMKALTEHLLDVHGVRRFAMVTGPMEGRVARERYQCCLQVLAERGVTVPEEAIYDGRWVRDGGRAAAESFLQKLNPFPEAIICGNDDMAFGVIETLQEAGIRVPEDVVVTGFDARSEAVGRGLTTVRRPVREAGEMAIETLLRWMEEGRPEQDEVILPTEIVFGDSCGCDTAPARSRDCVQQLSDERRLMEKCLRQTTDFVTALANVSTLREVGSQLTAFAQAWNATDMHCCVNPAFMSQEEDREDFRNNYPGEMLLLSGWSRGQELQAQRFATKDLLPLLEAPHDEPMALIFAPLHYMGNNLGYLVFDVEHVVTGVLPSLLLLMASSMMSLSLRAKVQMYANVLERISVHDELTGLHNRRGMRQLVPPVFERARQEQQPFAVVCCDMDDLKAINDRFGHPAGDQFICRLGRAIRVLEQVGLLCIHISGDEFLALGLLKKGYTPESLLTMLRESVAALNQNEPWLCDLTVSVGVYAGVPQPEAKLEDFIREADNGMYAEKHLHHRRLGREADVRLYFEDD